GPWRHGVWGLPGGTLGGIEHHPTTPKDDTFSEFRLGLDHVGFHVGNKDELKAWEARLNELGVTHGGIVDAPYGSGLSFRDPDGNALEFFAFPG
ncbi:MAG: VOC family protein, partial [Actinomycetota bacterium]